MYYQNYFTVKISIITITTFLSLLILTTMINAQVFKLGTREYRFIDSTWYNYSSNIQGDVIVPERLIVRLSSR